MKLIRYGQAGAEKPGVIIDDIRYDVSSFVADFDERFFTNGGLEKLKQYVDENAGKLPTVSNDERLGSPIARPSKILCVGLNYADHAKETNAPMPSEPILFMKSTTSLTGPNDIVVTPKNSTKTDWEVELGVVIGKKATYVDEAEAEAYIAGYVLIHDVSEREFQLERNGTWDKGKGCDTFAPIGPWLITPDEIGDVNNLKLWLKVNGKTMQNGTTANLIFKVPYLVSYISQFMTLLPGDVISTGTPAGVGLGFNPPIYLKHGDVVELGADNLGEQRQDIVAYEKL
ncbi:fumarylacetoacetate hydrolase family protein [Mucilaginibacter sp. RS28]|uniref:Fumarylacetoacetate hydrolase family protein n=1 Tax=Mucilaginibacter straminoryzae TaxID=2932774 RepID=A0A9X1X0M0_9SPHI|nr:fumarylacetoacetate hydrolase family protein [Mucilaginibacter straminoryzae]MCJ8209052.1 fumarylacetoacetate hydrolase family protein [Mucilaginibacter straminoryzae]